MIQKSVNGLYLKMKEIGSNLLFEKFLGPQFGVQIQFVLIGIFIRKGKVIEFVF